MNIPTFLCKDGFFRNSDLFGAVGWTVSWSAGPWSKHTLYRYERTAPEDCANRYNLPGLMTLSAQGIRVRHSFTISVHDMKSLPENLASYERELLKWDIDL